MGPIALEGTLAEDTLGMAWMLVCIAAGVFLMVRFGMLCGRTNVAEYNRDAVDGMACGIVAVLWDALAKR